MPEEMELQDQTNDRRYFTILPNMLDDSELSPYAVRLYLRIKRRAGEDGKCWENSRHLAEGCRMSRSQITRAKEELRQAGLIRIEQRAGGHGHFPGHLITVTDIWQVNIAKYSPVPVVDTSCPSGNPRPVPGVGLKKKPSYKKPSGKEIKKGGSTTTAPSGKKSKTDFFPEGEQVLPTSSINHTGLVEKVCKAIEEQGRTPNPEAVNQAITNWQGECERAKLDGRDWKLTNMDAILERYDIITLTIK